MVSIYTLALLENHFEPELLSERVLSSLAGREL